MMSAIYQLAIIGSPSDDDIQSLTNCISEAVKLFDFEVGNEVSIAVCPDRFSPVEGVPAAAVFFGGKSSPERNLAEILAKGIPVLPVVSSLKNVDTEVPVSLRSFNCIDYSSGGAERIATALLECVGLLSRQRRVFLSYKRDESAVVAQQLFEILSSKHFDVFLDTHGVGHAEVFQEKLWHRLSGSDAVIMLDTKSYFDSRWTSQEFGRALAKDISIIRVGWPGVPVSKRAQTAYDYQLAVTDFSALGDRLSDVRISDLCSLLERVRSKSQAIRWLKIVSGIKDGIEKVGGKFVGLGPKRSVHIDLPNGKAALAIPITGIPTSRDFHNAHNLGAGSRMAAVVYDHVGIRDSWLNHLVWLNEHINPVECIKSSEFSWHSNGWGDKP